MKAEYTMAEFIKEFKLGVDLKDSAATRVVATRLKELGYKRKFMRRAGGNSQPVWVKGDQHAELKARLAAIK